MESNSQIYTNQSSDLISKMIKGAFEMQKLADSEPNIIANQNIPKERINELCLTIMAIFSHLQKGSIEQSALPKIEKSVDAIAIALKVLEFQSKEEKDKEYFLTQMLQGN